jgi:preprotein translocase subunit SecA
MTWGWLIGELMREREGIMAQNHRLHLVSTATTKLIEGRQEIICEKDRQIAELRRELLERDNVINDQRQNIYASLRVG